MTGSAPEPTWLPAAQNPWQVPLLDVRGLTQQVTAWSRNPQAASNAISFDSEDGLAFADQHPESARRIPLALRYRRDRLLADGPLFLPRCMEHKWALFHHGGAIQIVRSWQRQVVAIARTAQSGEWLDVTELHGSLTDDDEAPEFAARSLDFLVRSHVLGVVHPAPLPDELAADAQKAATYCFSLYGNRALFATHHDIPFVTPEQPLRSHSLLHIAIARGDWSAAKAQIDAGLPPDLLAGDGLTPLHWAIAGGPAALAFVLRSGCPIDARSSEGATALMTASQSADADAFTWLLENGAAVDAIDHRGFSALHRAAEAGDLRKVEALLKHGADPGRVAMGRTARSLAELRGHATVSARLPAD